MKGPNYIRLTFEERVIIETLLREKKSKSYIAEILNRNRSTICREINLWVRKPSDLYKAKLADWYAKDSRTRRSKDKISLNKKLRWYVYRGLLCQWSPEQIAGRIKDDYPNNAIMSISHEAIYLHIYKHRQAAMNKKLIALLPYHHSRRKKRGSPVKTYQIKDRVSIDQRPKYIDKRKQVGHWEGDLMIGLKQNSFIGTLVERKTRFTYLFKLPNKKTATVTRRFAREFKKLLPSYRKSLTYDNGIEMANHKWFTKQTGMRVYFAHPYSSWERGTNENTNGLIRRFLPKQTDFNNIPEEKLKYIQDSLNNRPRKILNYKTPNEALQKELNIIIM